MEAKSSGPLNKDGEYQTMNARDRGTLISFAFMVVVSLTAFFTADAAGASDMLLTEIGLFVPLLSGAPFVLWLRHRYERQGLLDRDQLRQPGA